MSDISQETIDTVTDMAGKYSAGFVTDIETDKALEQLAEEGAARVFKPQMGSDWLVGVVGALQFDVLRDRIRTEYEIPVKFEATELYTARWLSCEDASVLKAFCDSNQSSIANDHDGDPVFMARNAWHLDDAMSNNASITFMATK